nr:hypothetical protein [Tanacetum cinerariifolium]
MAAPIISISSNSSDESVGSVMPRVILFGTILTEVPVVLVDLPLPSKVRAAVVASPAGVLEVESHSSSETGPSKSPLPLVPVAPMVSPFMCSDDSESDPTVILPERHVSSAITMLWLVDGGVELCLNHLHHQSHHYVLLHLQRYTSHHSSSDDFTSDSLPDSPLNSSSDSSSDHSLSDHSLSDHSLEDNIEEDIDASVLMNVEPRPMLRLILILMRVLGLDVEPSREDFPNLVSADGSLELYDHMGEIPVDMIASIKTG